MLLHCCTVCTTLGCNCHTADNGTEVRLNVENDAQTSLADVSQAIVGGNDAQPPRGTAHLLVTVTQSEIVWWSQGVWATTTFWYIRSLQRRYRH